MPADSEFPGADPARSPWPQRQGWPAPARPGEDLPAAPQPEPADQREGTIDAADGAGSTPPPLGGKLHPAAMVIWPFNQIFPIAVLIIAGNLAGIVALGLVMASLITSLIRYQRFSWRLDARSLVIEQGLIQRHRRVIPLERMQSVDLVRKVRHRMFGVVEVRVEAVGGSATEGKLDALAEDVALRLRAALLAARDSGTRAGAAGVEEEAGRPGDARAHELLVRQRPGQLVLAGLTGGRVGVVAAMLGAAEQLLGNRIAQLFDRLPAVLDPTGLVGLVLVIVALAFILSVAATTIAYWDFRLVRESDQLRVRRGLLEQRAETIPMRRVQALRIEENVVRRLLGLAAVKVDVAGKTGGSDARDTGLLLPLGTRSQARALVAGLLDTPGLGETRLASMPRRAQRRRLVRAGAATLALAAAAGLLAGWLDAALSPIVAGLGAAVVVGVPAVFAGLDAYRALGSAQVAGIVVSRAGVVVRTTAFVPIRNLQTVELRANPLQRAQGLATFDLQIARSPGVWRGPQLVDIDRRHGETLLHRLNAAVLASRPHPAAGRG